MGMYAGWFPMWPRGKHVNASRPGHLYQTLQHTGMGQHTGQHTGEHTGMGQPSVSVGMYYMLTSLLLRPAHATRIELTVLLLAELLAKPTESFQDARKGAVISRQHARPDGVLYIQH